MDSDLQLGFSKPIRPVFRMQRVSLLGERPADAKSRRLNERNLGTELVTVQRVHDYPVRGAQRTRNDLNFFVMATINGSSVNCGRRA